MSQDGFQRETEILGVLSTNPDQYRSQGLDVELMQIRQDREISQDPERMSSLPVIPLHEKQSLASFQSTAEGRELSDWWKQVDGGFAVQLARAQSGALSIIERIGDGRHQRVFMTKFDRDVSEKARYHIYNELTMDAPSLPTPVDDAALKAFGSSDIGAELVRSWGATAAGRIGLIHKRVDRFRRALDSQADFETFLNWYETLKPAEIKSILGFLSR